MKKGIDYFPFDVDFFDDEKIQFVSARFGIKGEIITIKLLTRIYRRGYYMPWDDDTATLFSKFAEVSGEGDSGLANNVVMELARRGFFDKNILSSFRVLTSRGIQSRYFEACRKRKFVDVDERYLLVNPSEYKNLRIIKHAFEKSSCSGEGESVAFFKKNGGIFDKKGGISSEKGGIFKQSRVKESKESTTTTNGARSIVIEKYEDAIHPITSMTESDMLMSDIEQYGEARVVKAIDRAVLRNKRSLAYVEAILRSWEANGYDEATDKKATRKKDGENHGDDKCDTQKRQKSVYARWADGDI